MNSTAFSINAAIIEKLREVIDIPQGVTSFTLRLDRHSLPVIELEASLFGLKEEQKRAD